MIEIFSPLQMKAIDEFAIYANGIPSLELMENAGEAFVEELQHLFPSKQKTVVVFCGKGNNGGDGFVIARLLSARHFSVSVVLCDSPSKLSTDAFHNYQRIKETSVSLYSLPEFLQGETQHYRIVIDAIFGTSFHGAVEGKYRNAVRWINAQKSSAVVAVDIPSGVNGETGIVETDAVRAAYTITFSNPKTGFFFRNARDYTGKIVIKDIGLPGQSVERFSSNQFLVEKEDCEQLLPRRLSNSHKHSVGKILVIAGSKGMMGAALLCSSSALRSGAGQVILGIPETEYSIAAKRTLEVMPLPLPSTNAGTLAYDSLQEIRSRIDWADVVVIGCGLSRNDETQSLICEIIRTCAKPMVIDADALTAIAGDISILQKRKSKEIILTPHYGEFSRFLGIAADEIETRKFELARTFAEQYRLTLVLKGGPTITAASSGNIFVNSTGNPGMSTAGAGDVLSGIIGALRGQKLSRESAAVLGVYIHGLAGDRAAAEQGEIGMIAGDIIKKLPSSFKLLA